MAATSSRRQASIRSDEGFGLVEVIVATFVMMLVVVSLANLTMDSLAAGLLSKQREAAASLAADVEENAKALGQTSLSATTSNSSCFTASTSSPVPILTGGSGGDFQQCFTTTFDKSVYTVSALVTPVTSGPDTVTVTVTWGSHSYLTTGQVGA